MAPAHLMQTTLPKDYQALTGGVALIDRSDRALLEVRGADRQSWLHNLTTNEVRRLSPGDGNYAFAVNVKGRIEFDLALSLLPESIWIDLPAGVRERAVKHLSRYHITEDIELVDRSGEFARLALAGPQTVLVMTALGAPNAMALAQHAPGQFSFGGEMVRFIRHDFCGVPAVDLFVPPGLTDALCDGLVRGEWGVAVSRVDPAAVEARRIEAGIPAWPTEIHDDILPAETAQLDRAVSFQKGCYLGQEVVERMRSRGGLARRLVGVTLDGDALPEHGAELHIADGATVGRVSSACLSPGLGRVVALAYAKPAATAPGTAVTVIWDGHTATGAIAGLPFL